MAKKYRKDEVVWLDRGWIPTYVGFAPSREAWDKEMRRLAPTQNPPEPYPTSDGRCTIFDKQVGPGARKVLILITISEKLDEEWGSASGREAIYGCLIHEAVHAWQHILDDIGERKPSPEFEAYSVQALFVKLASAYRKTRQARG